MQLSLDFSSLHLFLSVSIRNTYICIYPCPNLFIPGAKENERACHVSKMRIFQRKTSKQLEQVSRAEVKHTKKNKIRKKKERRRNFSWDERKSTPTSKLFFSRPKASFRWRIIRILACFTSFFLSAREKKGLPNDDMRV